MLTQWFFIQLHPPACPLSSVLHFLSIRGCWIMGLHCRDTNYNTMLQYQHSCQCCISTLPSLSSTQHVGIKELNPQLSMLCFPSILNHKTKYSRHVFCITPCQIKTWVHIVGDQMKAMKLFKIKKKKKKKKTHKFLKATEILYHINYFSKNPQSFFCLVRTYISKYIS
jgi:hypothetical protein